MHQDLIFNTSGGIGCQSGAFGRVKALDSLDQSDSSDGNQILLIRNLCVVFLGGLMLAGADRGE